MAASCPFGQFEVTPLNCHPKKSTTSGFRHIEADVTGKTFKSSVLVMKGGLGSQRKELEELEKSKGCDSSNINLRGRIQAPT